MKGLTALLLTLLLSACTTLPTTNTVSSRTGFSNDAAAYDHWRLTGRISLTQGETGWHGGIDWAEQADNFQLRVSGPLGQSAFLLTGNAEGVLLRDAASRLYTATNTDVLLAEVTGWELPVTGMRYWVRGLPDPAVGFQGEQDHAGRLLRLDQNGWTINYLRYHAAGSGQWPAKLQLARGDISLRIVIKQWQFGLPPVMLP